MLPSRIRAAWDDLTLPDFSSEAWRGVLVSVFLLGFLLGAAYHIGTWAVGSAPGIVWRGAYHVVVVLTYASFWFLLSSYLQNRNAQPTQTFFITVLVGIAYLLLAVLIQTLGDPALGLDYEQRVVESFTSVVKVNLLSFLEISFTMVVLLLLRRLVFYRRTRKSVRNWHLMLFFMVLAGLLTFMKDPSDDLGVLVGIALVPAVGMAVVNSFRVSWIVYLPFREKMATMGLAFFLMVLLGLALGDGVLPEVSSYARFYSYPLTVFALIAGIFGILYCVTTLLSLLFHLPTSSAFKRKADEMAAMQSLTSLISQVLDLEKLSSTIVASPVEAGSADVSWLVLTDGDGQAKLQATHGVSPAEVADAIDYEALLEQVQRREDVLLLDEAPLDRRVRASNGTAFESVLVVPLLTRNAVLGALFVARDVSYGFEKDDIESTRVYAAQAALALENARLFEEQLEKERLHRELTIAREVQQKLLPQNIPQLPGVAVAASSVSAYEVGGDYYDFVQLDDERLAFIVGDVAGKGTSGAFYMAEMQGIFRSLSHLSPDPRSFLAYANRAISSALDRRAFISVIYGVLDTAKEEFQIARAGHCPAAVINLHGEARLLRSGGIGLGLNNGSLFSDSLDVMRVQLQPGDVFVLYTDGVVESRDVDGDEYGYDRLLDSLKEHRHEEVDDLHDALLRDLHEFLGNDEYDDDLTLVVVKWHGVTVQPDVASTRAPATAQTT